MDEAATPPPPPPDPTVELRLSRLEADVGGLRQDMRGLRDDLSRFQERVLGRFATSDSDNASRFAVSDRDNAARFATLERDNATRFGALERELARLSGQVSQLPTTWTMATTFVSIVGVVAALGFAVARLLGRS